MLPMLKANPEFQAVARSGKRWTTPSFILQYLPKEDPAFRLGLTASRKVGNAVVRNRAKRRLREMLRLYLKTNTPTHCDIVLIAKTSAVSYDFQAMLADFTRAFDRLRGG
jgi:ribonuclease P protein component